MLLEVVGPARANFAEFNVSVGRYQPIFTVFVSDCQLLQDELSLTSLLLEQSCHVGVSLSATARHLVGDENPSLFIPEKYLVVQNETPTNL